MAFMNNSNGFNNQQNNNGEPKQKKNFKVGKAIYGDDGQLTVSTWNSDKGGTYAVLSIKAAIGKDPSTGMNAYEQKMSGELPSCFLNAENLCAIMLAMKEVQPDSCDFSVDCGRSKISFKGNGNNFQIIIENQKTGTRTITMKAFPVGPKNVFPQWKILYDKLDICYKKITRGNLDMDEFGTALAGDDFNNDDAPF